MMMMMMMIPFHAFDTFSDQHDQRAKVDLEDHTMESQRATKKRTQQQQLNLYYYVQTRRFQLISEQ